MLKIKDIAGYEYLYTVSSSGEVVAKSKPTSGAVRGILKARRLTPTDNGAGYKIIGLRNGKKKKNFYIHRLVATHFIDNPNNHKEVNHIDGNKSNNRADNLEWVNRSQNLKHSYRINLRRMTKTHSKKLHDGIKCKRVTIDEASEICEAYETGLFSHRELADKTGLSKARIMKLLNNRKILLIS